MSALQGKTVAIAGATGGLGPVVASRLAAAGATIAAADIDQGRLDALGEELAIAERYDGRTVNLLDAEETKAWADGVAERNGGVDAVLHLVGGWKGGEPLPTASLDDYEWLHNLLVRTLQHASRAFHDHLASSRGASS